MLAHTLILLFVLVVLLVSTALATRDPGRGYQAAIARMIGRVFPDDADRARCIAGYESTGAPGRFNPAAQNGSNTGLFEVDRRTWDPRLNPAARVIVGDVDWSRMHDPAYNARVARRIYLYERAAGRNPWGPWSTRSLCGA